MRKAKQAEQKEIGRIKLGNTQDLIVSIVDDDKVDKAYQELPLLPWVLAVTLQ